MRRATAALPVAAVLGALACGSGSVADEAPRARALGALATGDDLVRAGRAAGVSVRTGRRVVVVGARRAVVVAAGTRAALVPDLDDDELPEVAARLGPKFGHRLVVARSGGGRPVTIARRGWDVESVEARIRSAWIVVADDPAGDPWLVGFQPGRERWTWRVPLPADEIDDIDVQGDRVLVAVFVATGKAASAILDVLVRDDVARIERTDQRPAFARVSSARIEPAWRLDEILTAPREDGSQAGRVELVRPDGSRQTLSDTDSDVPVASLLRAGAGCAVVLLASRSHATTVTAVTADGQIVASNTLPRSGLRDVALVGRRLLISRREGTRTVVRALRADPRIHACG